MFNAMYKDVINLQQKPEIKTGRYKISQPNFMLGLLLVQAGGHPEAREPMGTNPLTCDISNYSVMVYISFDILVKSLSQPMTITATKNTCSIIKHYIHYTHYILYHDSTQLLIPANPPQEIG